MRAMRCLMGVVAVLAFACSDDGDGPDPGDPGAVLSRVDAELPGARCALGGSAVHTGLDDDGDRVLDDDEIDATSYVCSVAAGQIWVGNVDASAASNPTAVAALAEARVITGDIAIDGAPVRIALPKVENVIGGVRLRDGAAALELPALRTVGRDLEIVNAARIVELPALEHVGGDVRIGRVLALRATRVASIAGSLTIDDPQAEEVLLPALARLGGALSIQGALGVLDLGALRRVEGTFTAGFTAPTVRLDALERVQGDLKLTGGQVHAPKLEYVFGSLTGKARAIRLPGLRAVYGHVDVGNTRELTALELPKLLLVSGNVDIHDAPNLAALDLRDLVDVGMPERDGGTDFIALRIRNTAVASLSLAKPIATVEISSNPQLTSLELGGATGHEKLYLWDNQALTRFEWPATFAGAVSISANRRLAELGLHRLVSARRIILRDLSISDLSSLRGLVSLDSLRILGGVSLRTFAGMPPRARIGVLELQGSDITTLDGLQDTAVGGLELTYNHKLTTLTGLPPMTVFGNQLTVEQNKALASLDGLGPLTAVHGEVSFKENASLPEAAVTELLKRIGRAP